MTSDSIGIIDLDVDVFIWYYIALYILGSVHLLFSIWMVTEYFMLNWNNFVLPSFIYQQDCHKNQKKVCIWVSAAATNHKN